MNDFHSIAAHQLERFLDRRRVHLTFPPEMNLAENLVEVLRKANEMVPSAAGSILLDSPRSKHPDRRRNALTFIAVFGGLASDLVGQSIPASKGIAGHVYVTGEPYYAPDVANDPYFYRGIDEQTTYRTRSLVGIPIRIEHEVCGVLELINRQHETGYSDHDRNLLEIFAGYISISIQNVLDARLAQEIAKRDNLTGLYNDRFLHIALSQAITRCREEQLDLAVLFLDLDFFKRVNDSYGHLAGSQVLKEVGHLLRREVQNPEAISARYGGDEFVVVVPGMDLEGVVDLAESIRNEILHTTFAGEPGEIQPDPLYLTGITCSVGVATLNRHLRDEPSLERCKTTLLRLADAAMYVAKETGRNRTAIAGELVRRRAAPAD